MSYAPPSRRRDEDEEFQQPFTSTGRVGGSFVAPPTVPQQEPDFSTADFSAAFGDLNQPQQSEPDFSTADFGAAFADLAPSQPSAPAQREPIEQPKGWSGWDTAKTFGRSMFEGVANTIPFVDPLVVTDYEAAPAPTAMGAVGRYGNIGQDVVTGIGEFASGLVGGPAGPAVTAGGSSLLRSMERNDIEAMRRYMADNPGASIHEARSAVGTEDAPVAPMDSGDYMVAGLDAALANPAIRVGRWGSEAIARNPSVQTAVKSTLGVLGFDVGTGTIQAAADIINRENATPDQWNDALWEHRDELAAGAAMNAAISGGAQGIDIGAGIRANSRQARAQADLDYQARVLDAERSIERELANEELSQSVADEVFRADTNRLLAESQARSQAEIDAAVQEQNERLVRDFQTQRESQLRDQGAANPSTQARIEAQEFRDSLVRRAELQPYTDMSRPAGELPDGGGRMLDASGLSQMRESDVPVGFVPRTEDVLPTNLAPDANAPQMPGRPVGGQSPQPDTQTLARATQASSVANEPDFSTADPAVAFGDLPENQRMNVSQASPMASSFSDSRAQGRSRTPQPGIPLPSEGVIGSSNVESDNPIYSGIQRGEQRVQPLNQGDDISVPTYPGAVKQMQAAGSDLRDPETGELPTRVNHLNVNRLASDDPELQNFVAGVAQTNEDAIEFERMLDGHVLERAADIDKYLDINNVRNIEKNQALPDEDIIALASATKGKAIEAMENPTEQNLRDFAEYMVKFDASGTASSRALNARKFAVAAVFNTAPPKEQAMAEAASFWNHVKQDGSLVPAKILKPLAELKNPTRQQAYEELRRAIKKMEPFVNKTERYAYRNMLSSPETLLWNITGNAFETAGYLSEAIGSRFLNSILPGGGRKDIFVPGETRAALAGFSGGLKKGLRNGMFAIQNGYYLRELDRFDAKTATLDVAGGGANPMNWTMRLIMGIDEIGKWTADGAERSRLAHRKAYLEGRDKKGLSGDALAKYTADNAERFAFGDREISNRAHDFSERAVMRDESWITNVSIPKSVDPNMRAGLEWGLRRLQPFFKIGVNLVKRGSQNSPVGLIPPLVSKNMTREQRLNAVSRAVAGSMGLAFLQQYASEGGIMGSPPSDPRKREQWFADGNKSNSMVIGDKVVDLRMLGAYAYPLAALAAYNDAVRDKKLDPESNRAFNTVSGILKNFLDMPIVAGVSSLVEAVDSPRKGEQFLANITRQYIPMSSAQGFVNKMKDDYIPETNNYLDRVQAGTLLGQGAIPEAVGVEPLEPRLDSFGREIERKPWMPNADDKDPVASEMRRLNILPSMVPTSVSIAGESERLTPEQKREIARSGRGAYDVVSALIKSDIYKLASDEQKSIMLESLYTESIRRMREPAREGVKLDVLSEKLSGQQ